MTAQNPLTAAYNKSAGRMPIKLKMNKAVNQLLYNTKASTKKPASKKLIGSLKRLSLSQKQVAQREKATVFTLKDPFAKKSALVKVFIANSAGETSTFYSARGATHSDCSISGGAAGR